MTDAGKPYHNECTGEALQTVQRHAADEDITIFGSCFCPFVQRAWVALEYLDIPHKYYEVDPYKKPKELLELSPKGLVPALRLSNYDPPRALNESTVILQFLEDLASTSTKRTLLPPSSDPCSYAHDLYTISSLTRSPLHLIPPDARALVALQADHVNRILVPAFYRYLQAQDPAAQAAGEKEFRAAIDGLVALFERADAQVGGTGLWKEGGELGWADVMAVPWIFRATNVLKHYRGFEMPQIPRLQAWLNRLLEHPAVKSTCSTLELYIDSYERYAFNRPHTSQVADAINSGKALP